jgi:hypothetical protein
MSQEQNTTIVTAYFKLPQSKANHEIYTMWMQNMLSIQSPMVIFCDNQSKKQIKEFRKDLLEKTKIIRMKFEDFYCYKYFDVFQNDYETKDHEKTYHNPYLYLIWNEKSHFLKRAIELNPFSTEYFMWTDIGCFRRPNTQFLDWPNSNKMNTLIDKDRVLLLCVYQFTQQEYNCNDIHCLPDFKYINRIGGTIFGGTSKSILKWHELYYNMLEYFISIGKFIGKDQSIMSSVAIIYKEHVQIIEPNFVCNDIWFALQEYLS